MKIEAMEAGKSYFCQYTTEVSADTIPMIQGQLKGAETPPVITLTGIGQILKRDNEKRLIEVIDIQSRKTHVVSFDNVSEIAEAL
jgi:hypothetical protein